MGARVNKTDISDLTAALDELPRELRSSRAELARYNGTNFFAAIKVAAQEETWCI
ncbi:hypothetical protein QM042_02485 [Escherichia coli]|uniref:hypothetical protein n=1 Tax=Escherichia coli TaxID=562 RepID=UPI00398583C4